LKDRSSVTEWIAVFDQKVSTS